MTGLVICGPTGAGKTNLALSLAKHYDTGVISADSMQVYKYMNVGTAKITKEEMMGIEHFMIDIIEPEERFSVAEFQRKADLILGQFEKNKKIPIVAGGTGLYIKSIVDGLAATPDGDDALREKLYLREYEDLHEELSKVDPESAEKIIQNKKRVIRALEVFYLTGRKISDFQNENIKNNNFNFIQIGIERDRAVLYDRLNKRVDQMFENGLIEEAEFLYKNFRDAGTATQAIGYKELFEYFEGKKSLADAKDEIKKGTRHYAKRQFTWFKRDERIEWFNPDITPEAEIIAIIQEKISKVQSAGE